MSKTRKTNKKQKTDVVNVVTNDTPNTNTKEGFNNLIKETKDIIEQAEKKIKKSNKNTTNIVNTDVTSFNDFVVKILSDENTEDELNSVLNNNDVYFLKGLIQSKLETMRIIIEKIKDDSKAINDGNELIDHLKSKIGSDQYFSPTDSETKFTLREAKEMLKLADDWTNENDKHLFNKEPKIIDLSGSSETDTKKFKYNKAEILRLFNNNFVDEKYDEYKSIYAENGKLYVRFNTKVLFSIGGNNKFPTLSKYGHNFDMLNLLEFEKQILSVISIENIKYVRKTLYPNVFEKFVNKIKTIYNRIKDVDELESYENKYGCKVDKVQDTLIFRFNDKSLMFKGLGEKLRVQSDSVYVFLFNNNKKENELVFEANFLLSAINLVKELIENNRKFYKKYLSADAELNMELKEIVNKTNSTVDYLKNIINTTPKIDIEDLYKDIIDGNIVDGDIDMDSKTSK